AVLGSCGHDASSAIHASAPEDATTPAAPLPSARVIVTFTQSGPWAMPSAAFCSTGSYELAVTMRSCREHGPDAPLVDPVPEEERWSLWDVAARPNATPATARTMATTN